MTKKSLIKPSQDEDEERFLEYLTTSQLADKTIQQYQIYYRIFPRLLPLTEALVWDFLRDHKHSVARGFVRTYLRYKKVRDIDFPQIRGRLAQRLYDLITESDYLKLRSALYKRGLRWGLMFDISYWCALRREEICNMAPSWIAIEEFEEGKPLRVKIIGKGNKQRYAVIPADIAITLIKYIYDKFDKYEIGNDSRIFNVREHYWWRVLTLVSERELGKRYRPHSLRHSRATQWFKDGVDLLKIQKRLGHANLQTTSIYTHMSTNEVAEDWEKELNQK